jgi:bifunctional non-homologous end joining protein LigD
MSATTAVPIAPTSPKGLVHKAESVKGVTAATFDPDKYVMEPKYDGWRLLVYVAEDGVHLFSHTGTCHNGKLPELEAEFARLSPGTWIDGEAVSFTVDGEFVVHEWGNVQSILGAGTAKAAAQSHKITFVAFDLISHANIDARALPFGKRRALLEAVFEKHEWKTAILTPQMPPSEAGLNNLVLQGFEGAVVKSLSARYQSGARGAGQTKLKPQETSDFIVVGYKPGENSFEGMVGAIRFGAYHEGKLVEVGRCSGMDMRTRMAITKDPQKYLGRVFECAHFGYMKDGYRSPQWHRWRDDKDPKECVV